MAKKVEDDNVKPSEVTKMPKTSLLKRLLSAGRTAHKDSRSISGEYGNQVRDAVENEGVHKRALSQTVANDRMEAEKLADYFDHRDHYEEVLGLRERAAKAPRLGLDAGEGEEDDESETSSGKNVRAFPKPSSVAAE